MIAPQLKKTEPRGSILFNVLEPYLKNGDKVLDACCGYSPLAKYIINHGCKIIGFDNNLEAIKFLEKEHPSGTWYFLSYKTGKYFSIDVLLLLGVVHFYSTPEFRRIMHMIHPRIILLETANIPENIKHYNSMSDFLLSKGYEKSTGGKYDAELEFASERTFSLYTSLT